MTDPFRRAAGYYKMGDSGWIFKPRSQEVGKETVREKELLDRVRIGETIATTDRSESLVARSLCWRGRFEKVETRLYRRIK